MADTLLLPRRLAIRLLHEAQIQPGAEICGLVGADAGGPASIYPVANAAPDPAQGFAMDAQQQIAAMARMRDKGERLWAIYHSHPAAPPVPSRRDLAEAGYPQAYHLIVSLDVKGVLDLRCWEYCDGEPRERVLQIRENT